MHLCIHFSDECLALKDHADKMLPCRYDGMTPGVPLLGNINKAFLSFSLKKKTLWLPVKSSGP